MSGIIGRAVGIKGVFFALALSFGIGGLFSCILLLRKKAGMTTQVPFGPFLVIGTLIYFLLSQLDMIQYGGSMWIANFFS